MISVPAPAGATMAYRLDPYSLDVIAAKPKSMHDVVEPTILFYHRKNGSKGGSSSNDGSPIGKAKNKTPMSRSSPTMSQDSHSSPSCRSAPRSPAVYSNPTPTSNASKASSPGSIRYVTVSTITNPSTTLVAPFRVTSGDTVVFQSNDNGGEHFGTVTHVFDANYSPAGDSIPVRRLIRKARSADQEAQRRNAKEIEVVRSTITSILQSARPGGFVPQSLSAVEWQLDRAILNVQFCYEPSASAECHDLHALYVELVKQLQCEVYIATMASPQSSPALSDCGASSVGEPTSYGDFSC